MLTYNDDNNSVKIEGILSEIDLNEISYQNKKNETVEAISGTVKIRVNQQIDHKDCELDIPVHLFANKFTNSGKKNPSYDNLKQVKDEFASIAAVGMEQADKVRITKGTITMNDFYNNSGELVSYPRIKASFISKVTDLNKYKPEASFSITYVVGDCGLVIDNDGVEIPNRYKIRGIVPQYGGMVDVIDFYAITPSVIDVISRFWHKGDTVRMNGKLNFSSRIEEKEIEVDFGEPRIERHTVSVSELIIVGGSQTPLTGEFAFDDNDIKQALAERQNRLAELKNKQKTKKNTNSSKTPARVDYSALGF